MEWEAQKSLTCQLSTLECDTEVIYQLCLMKRQAKKEAADSREAAAKQLPPERQVATWKGRHELLPQGRI